MLRSHNFNCNRGSVRETGHGASISTGASNARGGAVSYGSEDDHGFQGVPDLIVDLSGVQVNRATDIVAEATKLIADTQFRHLVVHIDSRESVRLISVVAVGAVSGKNSVIVYIVASQSAVIFPGF
ncbi:MAG: hypothetical protein RBT76_11520 [candidate division Zixibacteria bacterium]|jgi:hypothetical protein|nr:hypothetical protein [candidate division Zixibacteria bacterium]